MSRIELFGIPIDALTMEETLQRVASIIQEGVPRQHMAVNAGKLVACEKDLELARVVAGCDLISADGAGVVLASKMLGSPLPERVAGVDMFMELVKRSAEQGWRPYFLGAREETVFAVVEGFQRQYPELEIAGWRNGYFTDEDEPGIVQAIRESRADLLFVAISSPKKEKFLGRWLQELEVPFCMGVGGSFDVAAGVTQRAPKAVQDLHMEWAWRFAQEPQRMWRRYLLGNLRFGRQILKARLGNFRIL